jgi:phosphatidylinositol alpha-mannosyltransferase
MKIAMISLYLPSGSKIGVGYQAHYMANALTQRGHQVTMFSQYGPTEGALYETITVPVGSVMRTFRFALNLRKIDFSGFDVIHAHTDDYWLMQRNKPPHIRTMHGACLAEAKNIPGVKAKTRMGMLALSEILATKVADRTVCVSENTRHYFPWLRDVVMNGVDTDAFRPGDNKTSEPTILFVGTYERRKRGKLLHEAFESHIRPALPNARLWMVCEDAPIAPGLTQFNRIPLAELTELYRQAWVFCLPSTYEGFGVPYIEAMASGTPVVATPNVGAREVLAEGQYGILTEPEMLGSTLLRLLQDATERERLTDAGLQRSSEFAWIHIIDQYEKIYMTTAANRNVNVKRPAAKTV